MGKKQTPRAASRRASPPRAAHSPSARRGKVEWVATRAGRLKKLGVNEWGKTLVVCPQCGGAAVTGRTGEVSCRECSYSTIGLAGCG